MKFFPLILALTLVSCGDNSGNDTATSIPIDSTKLSGTAPVQYGPDDPAADSTTVTGSNENVIQTNDGTMNRRTQSGVADGPVSNQQGGTSRDATGTGQNVGNTTDARTTGGSAQGSGGIGSGNSGGR